MKKKTLVSVAAVIAVVALAVCLAVFVAMNKAYRVTTFIVDGENYEAEVVDDGTLILNVRNEGKGGEWTIASVPEIFAPDFLSNTEDGAEFHIIPLNEGKGEMAIRFTADDDTTENYLLSLTISRHKKIYLQIDTVAFGKNQ